MHLDSLKIQNFRLLEDIEIKKLGHVNLIVGKNNSGKSTVLEALALLASGFDPKVVNQLANNRNINRHKLTSLADNKVISVANLFCNQVLAYRDVIYIGNDDLDLMIGASNPSEQGNYFDSNYLINPDVCDFRVIETQSIVDNKSLRYNKLLISSHQHLCIEYADFNKFLEWKARPEFEFVDTNPIDIEKLALYWDDVALTDSERLLIQMLQLIEPRIGNIAFLSDENLGHRVPYLRLNGVESRVPLHQMGDGIFRLLQIILKVTKAKDGFLLIDEFENGLHYSVQPEVWRLIFELAGRYNIQVFATTHSWDCIESFAQVAKEREDLEGVLFRMGRSVRKSDNGKVIATEFNEDELYNLTKDNIEVR